jgi:hypothetical protein
MPKEIADMAFKEAKGECLSRLERLIEVRRNEIAEAERAEARCIGPGLRAFRKGLRTMSRHEEPARDVYKMISLAEYDEEVGTMSSSDEEDSDDKEEEEDTRPLPDLDY